MDLGSILVGTILTAICILPFVLLHLRAVKLKRQKMKMLLEIAHAHGSTIDQYDFFGDAMIGMDPEHTHVFFVRHQNTQAVSEVVRLDGIAKCKYTKSNRTASSNNGNIAALSRIDLCFVPVNTNVPETKLELFNERLKPMVSNELEIAEKWSKLINAHLR